MGALFMSDDVAYISSAGCIDYAVDLATVSLVGVIPHDRPWRPFSDVEREAILSGAPFEPVNLSIKDFDKQYWRAQDTQGVWRIGLLFERDGCKFIYESWSPPRPCACYLIDATTLELLQKYVKAGECWTTEQWRLLHEGAPLEEVFLCSEKSIL